MNTPWMTDSLERLPQVLSALLEGIGDADQVWKPNDATWSLREIAGHLCDEEVDDFPLRLRMTLAGESPWPPLDPDKSVVERRHQETPLADHLAKFTTLRARSMEWLLSLDSPDWNRPYEPPRFGPFPAGDLLAAWCAHDQLHLKQVTQRLNQLTIKHAGKHQTIYAGDPL